MCVRMCVCVCVCVFVCVCVLLIAYFGIRHFTTLLLVLLFGILTQLSTHVGVYERTASITFLTGVI